MDDNKMLIDHMDILFVEDYNNNYSYQMIGKVVNNNIEVVEDDMMDNT
jgi:hypothetical protein